MQITLKNYTNKIEPETALHLDISFEELKFLRQNEPVAWATLMSGLERLGVVIAKMKGD